MALPVDTQRTRLTWPRPFLLRPWQRRLTVILTRQAGGGVKTTRVAEREPHNLPEGSSARGAGAVNSRCPTPSYLRSAESGAWLCVLSAATRGYLGFREELARLESPHHTGRLTLRKDRGLREGDKTLALQFLLLEPSSSPLLTNRRRREVCLDGGDCGGERNHCGKHKTLQFLARHLRPHPRYRRCEMNEGGGRLRTRKVPTITHLCTRSQIHRELASYSGQTPDAPMPHSTSLSPNPPTDRATGAH
jgi:hypothetical protein